jgi:hypothetical protein
MTFCAKQIILLMLSIKGAGGSLFAGTLLSCGTGAGFGFGR